MNRSTFATSLDNSCFEDYVAGSVYEFGTISVEQNECSALQRGAGQAQCDRES